MVYDATKITCNKDKDDYCDYYMETLDNINDILDKDKKTCKCLQDDGNCLLKKEEEERRYIVENEDLQKTMQENGQKILTDLLSKNEPLNTEFDLNDENENDYIVKLFEDMCVCGNSNEDIFATYKCNCQRCRFGLIVQSYYKSERVLATREELDQRCKECDPDNKDNCDIFREEQMVRNFRNMTMEDYHDYDCYIIDEECNINNISDQDLFRTEDNDNLDEKE